jgi:hypothetical protein
LSLVDSFSAWDEPLKGFDCNQADQRQAFYIEMFSVLQLMETFGNKRISHDFTKTKAFHSYQTKTSQKQRVGAYVTVHSL